MTAGRLFASIALATLAPATAAAQFTTFVAPPARVDTVIVTDTLVAAAPTADSLARANIRNMKAWVDSAAGNAVDLREQAAPPTPLPPAGDVFPDGAPAPDTATPLPLLMVLGAGAIGAGTVLLRRR